VTGSSGEENARLYERGVNDAYNDELLEARSLLDILDVFGEDGLRSYLVGVLEGEEDRREEDAKEDPEAVEVITDYETGEVTPIDREDEDEEDPLDDPDR
jgi:hypothetical protein